MEKLQTCPVCETINFEVFLNTKDHFLTEESFTISKCLNCGFLFTNPRPSETDSNRYYQSEAYISHSNTDKGLISRIYKRIRNHSLNKKISLIKKYIQSGNALDIGCGTGHFLNQLSKSGFTVHGIEPGEEARQFATKQFRLSIHPKLDAIDPKLIQYDVITLWHVLEHIYTLDSYMKKIRNLLSEKGILVVAVPNPESYDAKYYGKFWAAYDLPRHLYHFSQKTIQLLFTKYQFETINIVPLKFDSFYVSMLSEKYKTGKNNYPQAFFKGLKSNMYAKKNQTNYSSLIYVLKLKIS